MTFYLLERPDDYNSERDEIRHNGWGGFRVGMPGVDCSVCGDTRGMPGRVLPWRLPTELEQELRKLDFSPIPEDEHVALRQRVEAGLRQAHPDASDMPPGAMFPPLFWNFKDPPCEDFFWRGPLPAVSARLAVGLRGLGATGFDLIPVDRVRVGVPMPRKDNFKAWVTGGDGTAGIAGPDIFYLSISTEGRLNSRMRQLPPCRGCGYADVDRGFRWERWEDAMWDGDDIFHFATTSYIVVTERVAALLRELAVGNIVLTPLRQGKDAFAPLYRDFAHGLGRIIPWFAWRDLKRDGLD